MTKGTTTLPVLSGTQQEPVLDPEGTCAMVRTSCISSTSTAASDVSSESESEESVRDFSPCDIDWILTALSKDQQKFLDRSMFQRECQRIFHMMDKDESGFLDSEELEDVIAHLIPHPDKAISSRSGRHLMLSIKSVLSSFDKDSDRQLSSEEFPDFVRFCYAWRCQQEQMMMNPASDTLRATSRGRIGNVDSPPCGAAHRFVRSASNGRAEFPTYQPSKPPLKPMPRSESNPTMRQGVGLRGSSRVAAYSHFPDGFLSHGAASSVPTSPDPLVASSHAKAMSRSASNPTVATSARGSSKLTTSQTTSQSTATPRIGSPDPSIFSARAAKKMSRSASNPAVRSNNSSRRPSRTPPRSAGPGSRASSRAPSPEGTASQVVKPTRREDFKIRQMRALEALLKDLTSVTRNFKELVRLLMQNMMGIDGSAAFSKETLDHVCELVLKEAALPKEANVQDSPRSNSSDTASNSLDMFVQELGHFADPHCNKVPETDADEARLLIDRTIEAIVILSLRWLAIKHHMDVPEMSNYQKQKWLPPAFSYLVGQMLWRHRAADSLKSGSHVSTVENLRWITSAPGVKDDMVDQCNLVFRLLNGSNSGCMPLSQWRKVIELIAINPELRLRVRRVDAVRACYGDAVGHAENGLSRKNFKLMLLKTADLIGVHPVVIFQELASHADELEASQKAQKDDV